MIIFAWIITVFASIISIFSAFALLKAKDIFTTANIVLICNFYILPLLLLAALANNFSWQSLIKVLILIIINIIISNILCYLILQKSQNNVSN